MPAASPSIKQLPAAGNSLSTGGLTAAKIPVNLKAIIQNAGLPRGASRGTLHAGSGVARQPAPSGCKAQSENGGAILTKIFAMNASFELVAPEPAAPPSKPKILLVDDDPAIRQILVRLLSEENYLVLTAANGVEALVLTESARFDLVLLDLNMPLKNGWETFEQMSSENPLLPIILITARPQQFFPALASGAGALLEKPLDFTKLFRTIRDLLAESEEMRLNRLTGRASAFSYIPPVAGPAEPHSL
jgi:CheY-like chemotaxis protein